MRAARRGPQGPFEIKMTVPDATLPYMISDLVTGSSETSIFKFPEQYHISGNTVIRPNRLVFLSEGGEVIQLHLEGSLTIPGIKRV